MYEAARFTWGQPPSAVQQPEGLEAFAVNRDHICQRQKHNTLERRVCSPILKLTIPSLPS